MLELELHGCGLLKTRQLRSWQSMQDAGVANIHPYYIHSKLHSFASLEIEISVRVHLVQ